MIVFLEDALPHGTATFALVFRHIPKTLVNKFHLFFVYQEINFWPF